MLPFSLRRPAGQAGGLGMSPYIHEGTARPPLNPNISPRAASPPAKQGAERSAANKSNPEGVRWVGASISRALSLPLDWLPLAAAAFGGEDH